ncbi:calmodulin-beta [Strongylocentrotus purpuratus]|uniref:EF-hand domain-containing protein n=1 Tax=Strongylocentrotus purpuratus TaxID=7668 RepID=A0A7M7RIG5_STRPU|nr:calmodulin-beta [Strongylocentrotus purpuratus]|eukprot:XP_796091.1 PREDICTED: calmodulin-beta [Strongylocentrotus purpuratus]
MAAQSLSTEDIKVFRERFSVYDKNNDGTITTKELDDAMKAAGNYLTTDELAQRINEADTNRNGTIEFSEFVAIILERRNRKEEEKEKMKGERERIRKAFRKLDKNGDRFLSPDELRQAMSTIDPLMAKEKIEEMIYKADLNDDGYVSITEFAKMIYPELSTR